MSAAAAESERQIGSIVAGKYRLMRVLGRGGMGVVYEAEHTMTRRRVAIKILHAHHRESSSDAAKRFINEAQASGRVSHPNVVEVLDAGEDTDGSLYLVLELLNGHDLATQLARKRRLEVAETVTIIAQVLQALVVAHQQGIIHRDIKPENIFLTRSVTGDVHVKILDFGISKAIGPDGNGPALSVTQTNTTVGTPHYMSPEQARGERGIDPRADLWAVGVVMYECLAGHVPFDGETYNDQIVRVITEPHVPLSNYDVPLELSRIVDKALEKDRNRRYARAVDMLADLRRFVERHPEYAIPLHLLREPAQLSPTLPAARADSPTIETSLDPALEAANPTNNDTIRTAPAVGDHLPSIFDTFNEDAPTTVLASPLEATGPVRVPPLAGARPVAAVSPRTSTRDKFARFSGVSFSWIRERKLLIVAVTVALAALGGIVLAVATHRRTPAEAPSHATGAMVTLRFVGIPAQARLVVGGTPIYNSDTAVLPRGTRAISVEVSAPGYQTVRFDLVPDRDQTVPLILQPAVGSPLPAPGMQNAAPTSAPAAPGSSLLNMPSPSPMASSAMSRAARTVSSSPARARGYLTVRAQTPCTVSVDREIRGQTPIVRLALAPGPHQVTCRTRTGALRTRNISINVGQETVVNFAP